MKSNRVTGAIKATHPDFRYQPIAESEELGDYGRIQRVSAVLVSRQLTPGLLSPLPRTGQIAAVYLFFDRYAELDSAVLRHTDKEQFVGNSEVVQKRASGKSEATLRELTLR